jgi:hypothetical protein
MRERTAFILFGLGMGLLEVAWVVGLKLLGAGDELVGHTVILILPLASLGGGWLFMRYH